MSKLSTKLQLMLMRKVFHVAEVTQQGALLEGQSIYTTRCTVGGTKHLHNKVHCWRDKAFTQQGALLEGQSIYTTRCTVGGTKHLHNKVHCWRDKAFTQQGALLEGQSIYTTRCTVGGTKHYIKILKLVACMFASKLMI